MPGDEVFDVETETALKEGGMDMQTITKGDNGREIQCQLGESIQLELAENRSTGYMWTLRSAGDPILQPQSDNYQLAPGNAMGRGGTRQLVFRVASEGTAQLALGYCRSRENPPVDQFQVSISVTS